MLRLSKSVQVQATLKLHCFSSDPITSSSLAQNVSYKDRTQSTSNVFWHVGVLLIDSVPTFDYNVAVF